MSTRKSGESKSEDLFLCANNLNFRIYTCFAQNCQRRIFMMKRIEVVAAIIEDGDKILATQRGYGDYKDKWEFPGGKMEPCETPEEALVREIREELSADISVDRFVCTVEHDYPTFHLTMHNYLCHVVSGHLLLLEHEAAEWLDFAHIDSVDWLPADLKVLPSLKSLLKE